MKRQIFIRSFLISLVSVLVVFFAGIGITYLSNQRLVSERLVAETKIASALLDESADFERLTIFYNNDECRVTVMSLAGDVLFESDTREALENHLDRAEVRAAIDGQPRTVVRYSETLHCYMTYYAAQTALKNGDTVIVRLAVKSAETNSYILSALPFLLLSLILSAIIAGAFAGKLSRRVALRITDVAKSLSSVTDGTYTPLAADPSDREFYEVYTEINELSAKTVLHLQNEEAEHAKLNAVLDNISQGIIALSHELDVVLINGSALRLFGSGASGDDHSLDSLIGDGTLVRRLVELCRGDEGRLELVYRERILLIECIKPTGRLLESTIGHILILSDRTAERELARQKEEFFANASHELKTPLTAMLGLTELAMAREGDEVTRRQLTRIHKESLRLSELISDMLKLSRLESLREEETAVRVSLDATVREALAELSQSIADKGLCVSVTGEACVMADEKRMYELVQNLCSNAVNYNKNGGTIAVTLTEGDFGVRLSVRDTGIGIAKENLPHLCERFYRVDKSRSKKTGGTGLGLAIVKHICALYGAQIAIESEIDVGTEITVTFPTQARGVAC